MWFILFWREKDNLQGIVIWWYVLVSHLTLGKKSNSQKEILWILIIDIENQILNLHSWNITRSNTRLTASYIVAAKWSGTLFTYRLGFLKTFLFRHQDILIRKILNSNSNKWKNIYKRILVWSTNYFFNSNKKPLRALISCVRSFLWKFIWRIYRR